MSAHKEEAWFIRRSFWEGVTLLTVLHLSGPYRPTTGSPLPAGMLARLSRWGWRLARTLVGWTRVTNPSSGRDGGRVSIAQSAGVIRAALKLVLQDGSPGRRLRRA